MSVGASPVRQHPKYASPVSCPNGGIHVTVAVKVTGDNTLRTVAQRNLGCGLEPAPPIAVHSLVEKDRKKAALDNTGCDVAVTVSIKVGYMDRQRRYVVYSRRLIRTVSLADQDRQLLASVAAADDQVDDLVVIQITSDQTGWPDARGIDDGLGQQNVAGQQPPHLQLFQTTDSRQPPCSQGF
jgi:hypothetical protein